MEADGTGGRVPGFVCGLAGGILALVAIFRRGERAIAVYAAVVPLAWVVLFVLGPTVGAWLFGSE